VDLWQVLRVRIGQLEVDPHVDRQVVSHLRGTAADLEEAARQYKALVDRSRSERADSVEVAGRGSNAGFENPLNW
jgi:hypothetical protein